MTPRAILVTGAAGFLGGAALRASRQAWPHARVTGADLRAADTICDLTDPDAVAALVRDVRPDVILHLAGNTDGATLEDLWRANVAPLATVLDAMALHAPHGVVVVPGSAAEYGETDPSMGPIAETAELVPVSSYGVVKAWQTVLARSHAARGERVVVARLFNLCGPGTPPRLVLGGVAGQLRRIARGEQHPVVETGDLTTVRDFLDVRDACAALLALATDGVSGEVYNVCSGEPTVVQDAARHLVDLSGTQAEIHSTQAAPDRGNVPWSVGTHDKLRAATGWRPTLTLDRSLAATLG